MSLFENIQKGHFIIVNLHEQCYYDIYLDGKLAFQTYKESFERELFDYDNVIKWSNQTGVKPENFRYTYLDLYGNQYQKTDFDCNLYMNNLDDVLALNISPSFYQISKQDIDNRNW